MHGTPHLGTHTHTCKTQLKHVQCTPFILSTVNGNTYLTSLFIEVNLRWLSHRVPIYTLKLFKFKQCAKERDQISNGKYCT